MPIRVALLDWADKPLLSTWSLEASSWQLSAPEPRFFQSADGAVDATMLCANAFGNRSTREELPLLAQLSGRRNLSNDNFPRLVWFADPADRGSARKVTLDSISEIDASARPLDAFVEITRDPIVVDIEKRLPWLPAMQREQAHLFISRPSQFHLVNKMFSGEDS